MISEYIRRKLNLVIGDEESRFLLETFSNKWGNKFYEMLPAFSLSYVGDFRVEDKHVG